MRVSTLQLSFTFASLAASPAFAADYYVAPNGNDSNAGTEAQPFASVGRGQQEASAGDTVWVRGGTYSFSSGTVGVAFSKAGQNNNPIQYFAYPGEIPIFDLSAINPSGRVTGFDVNTDNIHIRGMEITGVPQFQSGDDSWALRVRGDNNVIELMNVHHNEAPGIFITSGANNLILNCDSHHNYDVLEGGGSGDGFGCHSTGGGNVMSGCRGWENSDDGYDFINAPGVCTVENSWSWRNGWVPDTNTGAGNGAGFKAGGFGLDTGTFPSNVPTHVVRKCLSWSNRAQGFYANHHPGAIDWLNNTAYNNPSNYNMLDDVGQGTHYLRNNIAYGTGGDLSNSTSDDAQSNSWNGGVTVSDADFQSLDATGADGPRGADGSLPVIAFMHLAPGSDLIDAGEDVGLPYSDAAPDLGCFETGEVATATTTDGGVTATTGGGTTTTGDAGMTATSSDAGMTATSDGGMTATTTDGGVTTTGGALDTSGSTTGTTGFAGTDGGLGTTGGPGGTTGAAATTAGGASAVGGPVTGSTGLDNTSGVPMAPVSDEAGCSCSLPGRSGTTPGALLLTLLAGSLLFRRRS
jgi:hypothetical protein